MGRPETGRTGARFGAPARRARGGAAGPDPAGTPEQDGQPEQDGVPVEGVTQEVGPDDGIGLTGARFGGRARRSRKERPAPVVARDEPPDDIAGADRADARPTVELPRVTGGEPPAAIGARPYVLTGGRTKVRTDLRIETLVSALGPPDGETGERRTVLALCERPRSVGEVAALTGVPLGVARVLIDDLAAQGRVRIHLGVDAASGPDLELLGRVLAGLRCL